METPTRHRPRRTLLIGHRGQLGSDLKQAFSDDDLRLSTQDDLRVEDPAQVNSAIAALQPDLILNCAAFHRVDDCEDNAAKAFDVNVLGVYNLAKAAALCQAVLVHFSTDYVFDGPGRTPYLETDMPCPQSVYGASKVSGEYLLKSVWPKHFIFRVSGLYGYAGSREKGTNFVELMLGLARQSKPIRVVNDQVLTPTSTMSIARAVHYLVQTDCYGLYHLTSAGECSWYEFASAIFKSAGVSADVMPVTSDAFPTKAKRPGYSALDNRHLRDMGFPEMPHWREALNQYLAGRAAAGRE